jgi:hypothetical protein
MGFSSRKRPSTFQQREILFWLVAALGLTIIACNFVSHLGDDRQGTQTAVGAIQTDLSQTSEALLRTETSSALATLGTPLLETSSAFTSEVPGSGTLAPLVPTAIPEVDERLLKSAKILLFENMSASRHIRYVKEALDRSGYFYLDVGSATGWFKNQLNSPIEWDLIIAAAEARRDFGGEFFGYIDDRVAKGAGAIVEYWDIDSAPEGRVMPFLDRCGVKFQLDWYEPEMRVFFWLVPENPIFHQPNQISVNNIGNAESLWSGDIGDLLEIKYKGGQPLGDAVLLAGTNPNWKNDHGTLVSCVSGRVIIQTFSSHEYQYYQMVQLWQNYVYQALKNHFAYTGASVPTPAITAAPTLNASPTSFGPTPGPAYLFEHACGDAFTVRLEDAPRFEKDLFEHHAAGNFLILRLQLINHTNFPIQIWDEDYSIEGTVNRQPVVYFPHKAATGYLYIDTPTNLYQDLIQPNETWRTIVAFDVDPSGEDWTFVLKPGSEFNQEVCEARIPLNK